MHCAPSAPKLPSHGVGYSQRWPLWGTSGFSAIGEESDVREGQADSGEIVIAGADRVAFDAAGFPVSGCQAFVLLAGHADGIGVEFRHGRDGRRCAAALFTNRDGKWVKRPLP